MNTKNPGLALLEKKVDELGLRRKVEEELAQVLIEHKIADLRKRKGLTQAALARRSGVSQPMIAQIESGKLNNLTLKTLARTARALGASLKIDLISRSETGEVAAARGRAAVLSDLARSALAPREGAARKRNGVPLLPPRRHAGLVTPEVVNRLRDDEA
jgi:transcriptional regulator with XRE-family HTH domain